MYYSDSGNLILSPGDLVSQSISPHVARMYARRARGEIEDPAVKEGDFHPILRELGLAHEQSHLNTLRAQGGRLVAIERSGNDETALAAAEARTVAAMAEGADVIYQGTFFDGLFRGHADFLVKVDGQSRFGDWAYEVFDTKLKARADAQVAVQLSEYNAQLARLQESSPQLMHVVLASGEVEDIDPEVVREDYLAIREALLAGIAAADPAAAEDAGFPDAAECTLDCPWRAECKKIWKERDLVVQLPGIYIEQARRLWQEGITTVADFAVASDDVCPMGMAAATFAGLREHARLLVERRETGRMNYRVRPMIAGKGFDRLPAPSRGDVFYDIEGNPLMIARGGLEYLHGVMDNAEEPSFTAFWGHDSEGERRAFNQLLDYIAAKRAADPDMHVYHYATYEPAALRRLARRYDERGDEVERLIEQGVFVDLLQVVKQGMRIGTESYSIKKLEPLYMPTTRDGIKDAASSVVAYHTWTQTGDDALLREIEEYNRDDVQSTMLLRDWLETIRPEMTAPLPLPPRRSRARRPADIDDVGVAV